MPTPVADVPAVDATLLASRALLGVVANSVTGALQQVTLPQFRVLVILSSHGPLRIGALAELMHANPSTFSRTVDRLELGSWVERRANPGSRREVLVEATDAGLALVDEVTQQRRAEIARILERVPATQQALIAEALTLFADAAGERYASSPSTLAT